MRRLLLSLLLYLSSCSYTSGGRLSESTVHELKVVYSSERLNFVIRNNDIHNELKIRIDLIKKFLSEFVVKVEYLSSENRFTERNFNKLLIDNLKELKKYNLIEDEKIVLYKSVKYICITVSFLKLNYLNREFNKI